MSFELDAQTKQDLELFPNDFTSQSVFSLFDKTKTKQGQSYLYSLMEQPLLTIGALRERTEIIDYLSRKEAELHINQQQTDFIEKYLNLNIPVLRQSRFEGVIKNIRYNIKPDNDYYLITTGIDHLSNLFDTIEAFLNNLYDAPPSMERIHRSLRQFFKITTIKSFRKTNSKPNYWKAHHYDSIFRKELKQELIEFLERIYLLDALISVSKCLRKTPFTLPSYQECSSPCIELVQFHHPLIPNAKPYDFKFTDEKNLCFLTGANMAGKSTFLKAIGICLYLAHLGFPVPAQCVKTSIYNGLITTINLHDNRKKGQSHFYSEVIRIKETALKLQKTKNLFVIFDELFRGTNVKDAHDASRLIIEAFARIKTSSFLVSTHITEIADTLRNSNKIDFKYFDSSLINGKPQYSYRIKNGVSHERMGVHILKNEKVLEALNSII